MAHTMHFHGFHAANMDGTYEIIEPGHAYTYEFTARPFGLHLYHCHVMPLSMHVARGLYGTFVIDPKAGRPKAREMVMVMNGFDTDFDGGNELYTVNGVANCYQAKPIQVKQGELQRVYLVNVTEFDLLNSFHIHANFFHVYRTGTRLTPDEFTDTVMLCQGQRFILEFTYDELGQYMFHAHQSEFAELGWLGVFDVRP
jgi:FtsP/CotA-like multicopper oxidase with cupredoxin domain